MGRSTKLAWLRARHDLQRSGVLTVLIAVMGLAVASSSASAQDDANIPSLSSDQSTAALNCFLRIQPASNSELPSMMYASCNGIGFIPGPADKFRAFDSSELNAKLVEATYQARTRLLLFHTGADGAPLLEDVTSIVAVSAGRAPTSGIDGLVLEYADFPERGAVGIRSTTEQGVEAGAPESEVLLAEYLARAPELLLRAD